MLKRNKQINQPFSDILAARHIALALRIVSTIAIAMIITQNTAAKAKIPPTLVFAVAFGEIVFRSCSILEKVLVKSPEEF